MCLTAVKEIMALEYIKKKKNTKMNFERCKE